MPERPRRVKPSFRSDESTVSEETLKSIVGEPAPPKAARKRIPAASVATDGLPRDASTPQGMTLKMVNRSEIIMPEGTLPAAFHEAVANSQKQYGLIQPLVVRLVGEKYQIVLGRQRYLAAERAGIERIPVVVQEMDDATYKAVSDEHTGPPAMQPLQAEVTLREPEDPAVAAIVAMQTLLGSSQRPTAAQRRAIKNLSDSLAGWVYRFGPLPLL